MYVVPSVLIMLSSPLLYFCVQGKVQELKVNNPFLSTLEINITSVWKWFIINQTIKAMQH